jgi:environmental stress-induced protein Ves
MHQTFQIHPFSQAISTKWSGGATSELFIFPLHSNFHQRDFIFRISSATVETEKSKFTLLPNFHRYLVVLEGRLKINHLNHFSVDLVPFESTYFEGDWETESVGKVRDFNLIFNDTVEVKLTEIKLVGETQLEMKSDFLFLFQLDDSADWKGFRTKKYDLLEIKSAFVVPTQLHVLAIEINYK